MRVRRSLRPSLEADLRQALKEERRVRAARAREGTVPASAPGVAEGVAGATAVATAATGARVGVHADGICEPRNPGGVAAWAYVLRLPSGERVEHSGVLGEGSAMSNHVAEYAALVEALRDLKGRHLEGSQVTGVRIRDAREADVRALAGLQWALHGEVHGGAEAGGGLPATAVQDGGGGGPGACARQEGLRGVVQGEGAQAGVPHIHLLITCYVWAGPKKA